MELNCYINFSILHKFALNHCEFWNKHGQLEVSLKIPWQTVAMMADYAHKLFTNFVKGGPFLHIPFFAHQSLM